MTSPTSSLSTARSTRPNRRAIRAGSLLLAALVLGSPVRAVDPPVLTNPHRSGNVFEFTLLGESNSTYRIESSQNLLTWTAIATNTDPNPTRFISVIAPAAQSHFRAARLGTPYFRYALAATEFLDLNGQNLSVDSFNSSLPASSTSGGYDPAKALDHGDAAVVRGLTNSSSVGNAVIAGTLRIGAGGATQIGAQGSVGSRAWVAFGNLGIQPGHLVSNLVLTNPPVPSSSGGFIPTGGLVDGVFYDYVLNSGTYQLAALGLSTSQRMYVRGQATLNVSGGVTIAGVNSLVIATNASLRLFVGGANMSLSMSAVPSTRLASQFQIYGLPGNSSINLLGGPYFIGTVFAPSATLSIGTPGAGTPALSGAYLARSIRLSSGAAFHFDEGLVSGPTY